MNFGTNEFTLLSKGQVERNRTLNIIKKTFIKGFGCLSDFAILLGADVSDCFDDNLGWWYLSSPNGWGKVDAVNDYNFVFSVISGRRSGGIRPVLSYTNIYDIPQGKVIKNGLLEVEYGEYPQYAVDVRLGKTLDYEFSLERLKKTGKTYTTDSRVCNAYSKKFMPFEHEEFEYQGKKYVRVKSNCCKKGYKLSNGVEVIKGDIVWVEVSPIKWYIDESSKLLISEILLVSGIRFCNNRRYKGDFWKTEMYTFLNTYFAKDMVASVCDERVLEEKKQHEEDGRELRKEKNPYAFKLNQVSEEEIIRGAIESDVPVFLHGASSEGKSSRVKQIDPTCEIIYLRNATPESLNGKSVYNQQTGKMIDIMPSWLKKVEEKCKNEPDKLHVVFFDEITNALPSIQGTAFNIVLDKEVNGIWKLPKNVRIVAAGNDMKDSLAANQLAEPLFNRFAHVYIKTTIESWLMWASEHNIHPAIYSFIAYKKEKALRSKYDGEKPNADPRKWEMASKMLYATGNPEMLRALVGEEMTREFVQFCNQQIITLDDVINENYTDKDIQLLNTAERYATIMGLSQVDDFNLEKVREFVLELGVEFGAIFDVFWTHGDESKLERFAEAKLAEMSRRRKQ